MTEIYASASLALVLAWIFAGLLRLALPPSRAVPAGILLSLAAILLLHNSLPIMVLASVLAPFSVGLSAIILRALARPFTSVKPVPTWELALFTGLIACYLAASAGMSMFDPYTLGYNGLSAGIIALVLTSYAVLRGYFWLALVPVLAQAMWLSGTASSNYLDHLLHGAMLPVFCLALVGRLVRILRSEYATIGN